MAPKKIWKNPSYVMENLGSFAFNLHRNFLKLFIFLENLFIYVTSGFLRYFLFT